MDRNTQCIFAGGKKVVTKDKRWYKDVGLGFKTPSEAINGTYIGISYFYLKYEDGQINSLISDKKCPFTGDVSIRGRILTGKVVSTKMTRTIIIRRDYLHYIPKYSMYRLNYVLLTFLIIFFSIRPLREEA